MVGYADSRALPHGAGFDDAEAFLRGQSALGLQTWNSVRALDLLASLPEVDATRIGVTGGSGGGTQTFLLCAVDPRPAVSVPCVMVSTTMQGGCVCENAPHLRIGAGNVELAALAAPRPLGLTAANDWTVAIEERGLPELRRLYGMLGVDERLEAWVHPQFGHNYNAVSRADVYAFLDRHLGLGAGLDEHPLRSAALEERFEPLPPARLSIAATAASAQSSSEGALSAQAISPPGLQEVRRAWTEQQESRLVGLLPRDAGGLRRWREVMGGALEVLVPARLPEAAPEVEVVAEAEVVVAAEPEVADSPGALGAPGSAGARGSAGAPRSAGVPGSATVEVLHTPDARVRIARWDPATSDGSASPAGPRQAPRGVLLLAGCGPLGDLCPPVGRPALESGLAVVQVEVLLEGEDGILPVDGGRHGKYPGYTWCYNETLAAQRLRDLLVAARRARDLVPAGAPLRLHGDGWAGPAALLAAGRAPGTFERVSVGWDWNLSELAEAGDRSDPRLLPGALAFGGVAGLGSLHAPGLLMVVGDELPPLLESVWSAAGARDALSLGTSTAAAAAWLGS